MTNGSGELERQRFTTYALSSILPDGDVLTLDSDQGILSQLHECNIIEQQLLSPSEMYVVEALLKNHPNYSPYEMVLSAMTGKSVEKCRERVNWGLDNTAVDVVMRPVRNLLGRVRMKLNPFGVQVKSIVNMGYMLVHTGRGIR